MTPPRRWSFTLRTVFLLSTVAAIGLGFVAKEERAISERTRAMDMVGDQGLTIWYALADDRERHTHYANSYRRWQDDPLAQAIWLPEGALNGEQVDRVKKAFPEARVATYEKDHPSSAGLQGCAVFVFSDSLEAVGLDAILR